MRGGIALSVAIALALSALAAIAQAPEPVDPPAERARLAARSLLLDITWAGERLVAVGERGHVLYSDDHGATWKQARSVPTSAMLTGVYFGNARRGWAVGHDEVVLRTEDGGDSWQKTHYAPEAQQPLLDVWFGSPEQGIAIGAYGSYYVSTDGGGSWSARAFEPSAPATKASADASLDESAMAEAIGSEFHLNQIAATGDRLYIAAEAGRLFGSADRGATWRSLPSPYEGSFFGVLPLEANVLLAFGLRGNLFRSEDAGDTWTRIPTGTVAMLTDGVRLADRSVVIVGLSGTVLVSRDAGRSFKLMQQDDRKGLSAVVPGRHGGVIATGEGGIKHIAFPGSGS